MCWFPECVLWGRMVGHVFLQMVHTAQKRIWILPASSRNQKTMEPNSIIHIFAITFTIWFYLSIRHQWSTISLTICLGVSKNSGTPKSSILIGFSIINHPFWGTPILGNTHLAFCFNPKLHQIFPNQAAPLSISQSRHQSVPEIQQPNHPNPKITKKCPTPSSNFHISDFITNI